MASRLDREQWVRYLRVARRERADEAREIAQVRQIHPALLAAEAEARPRGMAPPLALL